MKLTFYLLFFGLVTLGTVAQNVAVYDSYVEAEKGILKEESTVYVINFWATWCAPCVKELPLFEKLHLENKNVKVILVSLDSKKDLNSKLLPFLNRKKITAEVIQLTDKDYNSWLPKVDNDWSGSIPSTWLVQGKRKLFVEKEFKDFTELNEYVKAFINLNK
jgi:thiol-disulfide isomerase/thioredoxin